MPTTASVSFRDLYEECRTVLFLPPAGLQAAWVARTPAPLPPAHKDDLFWLLKAVLRLCEMRFYRIHGMTLPPDLAQKDLELFDGTLPPLRDLPEGTA